MSTFVKTNIVLLPCGSIFETSSVTLLRSASTLPSLSQLHYKIKQENNGFTLNAKNNSIRIRHISIC